MPMCYDSWVMAWDPWSLATEFLSHSLNSCLKLAVSFAAPRSCSLVGLTTVPSFWTSKHPSLLFKHLRQHWPTWSSPKATCPLCKTPLCAAKGYATPTCSVLFSPNYQLLCSFMEKIYCILLPFFPLFVSYVCMSTLYVIMFDWSQLIPQMCSSSGI